MRIQRSTSIRVLASTPVNAGNVLYPPMGFQKELDVPPLSSRKEGPTTMTTTHNEPGEGFAVRRLSSPYDPHNPPSPLNGRPQRGFVPLALQEATPKAKTEPRLLKLVTRFRRSRNTPDNSSVS